MPNLPSPTEVIETYFPISYAEFDTYARTYSFKDGPYRETQESFEKRNAPTGIVFGTLRTGRKIYAEVTSPSSEQTTAHIPTETPSVTNPDEFIENDE